MDGWMNQSGDKGLSLLVVPVEMCGHRASLTDVSEHSRELLGLMEDSCHSSSIHVYVFLHEEGGVNSGHSDQLGLVESGLVTPDPCWVVLSVTLWGSAGVDVAPFLVTLLNTQPHSAGSIYPLPLCDAPRADLESAGRPPPLQRAVPPSDEAQSPPCYL